VAPSAEQLSISCRDWGVVELAAIDRDDHLSRPESAAADLQETFVSILDFDIRS
jgi:hypothetical protein